MLVPLEREVPILRRLEIVHARAILEEGTPASRFIEVYLTPGPSDGGWKWRELRLLHPELEI